jgi:hypothetical protein
MTKKTIKGKTILKPSVMIKVDNNKGKSGTGLFMTYVFM